MQGILAYEIDRNNLSLLLKNTKNQGLNSATIG